MEIGEILNNILNVWTVLIIFILEFEMAADELVVHWDIGLRGLFWRLLGTVCQTSQQLYCLWQTAQSFIFHYRLLETQWILKHNAVNEQV